MRPLQLFIAGWLILLTSCYRESIQFEGDPPDSYTQVVKIDTITPVISTVMIDSFATGGTSVFLIGSYDDPHFGKISSSAFLQIGKPAAIGDIAETAVYDSLVLIVHFNKYFYGDSTKTITIDVHELDESIELGYNDKLYNTSDFSVKPSPLGSKQLKVYPNITDSVIIRLDNAKGQELFSKIKTQADELSSVENFLNYFKGIRISAADASGGVVYGLNGAEGSMIMRLHYHNTTPFPQEQYVDFSSQANSLAFRQTIVTRNGSLPDPTTSGKYELPSSETNNTGYTQPATGVMMKIIFPGLRNILSTDKPLNLLHAELIIRPMPQSFADYSLPPLLQLMQTNESNLIGGQLADSTGQAILTAAPVIDHIYGLNNYYRFNITNYINDLLHTTASTGEGFFVVSSTPEQAVQLNRAIFGDVSQAKNKAQLNISIVTVNLD
jgi:hypothetical protein